MTDSEPEDDGSEEGSRHEEESEEGNDDVVEVEELLDPVPVPNPFCVCPRGTTRTPLGHAWMEPGLSLPRTNSSPKT